MAPEVVRTYKALSRGSEDDLPAFELRYLLVSILFVGLGGMFAVAWGEDNAMKCLWVGLSLPVIVSSLASQMPS